MANWTWLQSWAVCWVQQMCWPVTTSLAEQSAWMPQPWVLVQLAWFSLLDRWAWPPVLAYGKMASDGLAVFVWR